MEEVEVDPFHAGVVMIVERRPGAGGEILLKAYGNGHQERPVRWLLSEGEQSTQTREEVDTVLIAMVDWVFSALGYAQLSMF